MRVGGGEGRRVLTVSLSTVMVILDWKMEQEESGRGGEIVMLVSPLQDVGTPPGPSSISLKICTLDTCNSNCFCVSIFR